jgi:hypothetical protein
MHTQNASDTSTEVCPTRPVFLLIQRGLDFTRQGQDAKGVALFELAREQLTADQEALASHLNMFIQGHKAYVMERALPSMPI